MPGEHDFDLAEVPAWERQPGEPSRQHGAFRMYRDADAAKRNLEAVATEIGVSARRVREWAVQWDWRERTAEWDDALHRVEDKERLEAIRSMHKLHRGAGRAAIQKALQALQSVDPQQMPVSSVARLLELGAKLERSTLIVSVEELQGLDTDDSDDDDPWERIAAELDPANAAAIADL